MTTELFKFICVIVAFYLAKAYDIQYLPRLVSDFCDEKRCPAPTFIDIYQIGCKYKCPSNHRFVCLEDSEENVIEFFLPDNFECEPGFKVNVSIDGSNTSRVQLHKVPCPSGTYQQYTSNCLDACVKQDPASLLPHGFKPFKAGNTKEPMKVVCDHEKGYFSSTNRTWYYYDNNFSHYYWSYCEQIENNTCPDGQRPLKNGSCVCGSLSDDDSKCVPMDLTKRPLQSTKKSTDTEPSNDVTYKSNQHSSTVHTIIGIILGVIAIVGLIGLGIAVIRNSYHNMQVNNNFYERVTVNGGNDRKKYDCEIVQSYRDGENESWNFFKNIEIKLNLLNRAQV